MSLFAGFLAIGGYLVFDQSAAQISPAHAANSSHQLFAANCASCHGLDGRGGERAPNIAQRAEIQHLSDGALTRIIQDGVAGTGMPAFRSLTATEVRGIVGYLRILQGANQAVALPGDPGSGQELFFGKAGCSACHMVAGKGGFIAPDLSSFARTHSAAETRTAITNPGINADRSGVIVSTRDGQKYAGRIRNQDNFSLQLQTLDGTFHFFSKPDIERIEPDAQADMPTNYGSMLSSKELDDVVSYLIISARTSETPAGKGAEDRE